MAALSIALAWPSMPLAQSPTPTTDADAQAIYAVLLPPMWATSGSKGVLRLQRETVTPLTCGSTSAPFDAEWDAAKKNYAANTRVQLLPRTLRLGVPHRFVAESTIAAEDARLRRKYPGSNVPPGPPYTAVSAVGFNSARTRAIVYARRRGGGDVHYMEKHDGRWVRASRSGCHWAY